MPDGLPSCARQWASAVPGFAPWSGARAPAWTQREAQRSRLRSVRMRGRTRGPRDLYEMAERLEALGSPKPRSKSRPPGPLCTSLFLRGYLSTGHGPYRMTKYGQQYIVFLLPWCGVMVQMERLVKSNDNLNATKTQWTGKERQPKRIRAARREGVKPREHARRRHPQPRDPGSIQPPLKATPCTAKQKDVSARSSSLGKGMDTYGNGEVSCYRTLADVHKLGDAHEEHC